MSEILAELRLCGKETFPQCNAAGPAAHGDADHRYEDFMQSRRGISIPATLLAACLSTACGGGGDLGPRGPIATGEVQRDRDVLALYYAAAVHASLAGSMLESYPPYAQRLRSVPCARVTVDGSAPAMPVLPTGAHTAAAAPNCDFSGATLSGVASMRYDLQPSDSAMTATITATSMRGAGLLDPHEALGDYNVTADGSWDLTSFRTAAGYSVRYTPIAGARLVNNRTGGAAVFEGGSLSYELPLGWPALERSQYDRLAIRVNGSLYVLDGAHLIGSRDIGNGGAVPTGSGEVTVTKDGAVVARLIVNAQGQLGTEVLGPMVRW